MYYLRWKILLGNRNNKPLKVTWFTPGGRLLTSEAILDFLRRVAQSELGLTGDDAKEAGLIGIWNHYIKLFKITSLYMHCEKA